MKRPQPDLGTVLVSSYIEKVAFVKKFLRYWGTTTVDGVEVLTPKKYYYKNMDESTEKLAKFLGVYKDLKSAKMKGISSAWLFLNHRKVGIPDYDGTILASNLDTCLGAGRTVTLVLGAKVGKASRRRYIPTELVGVPVNTAVTDQVGIIAEIRAEYQSYWNEGYLVNSDKQYDVYYDLLTRYVLFSGQVPFTVTGVKKTVVDVSVPIELYDYDLEEYVTSYRAEAATGYLVTINIGAFAFTDTTDIVAKILADAKASVANTPGSVDANIELTRQVIGRSYDEDGDENVTYVTYPFDDLNAFWHVPTVGQFNDVRYLKASTLTGGTLTLNQKIALIQSLVDGGYKAKSRDAWETLLAIVIVVIIIYVTKGAGAKAGAAAIAAGHSAVYAAVITLSITVTTVAFVIAVVAAMAGALGLTGTAIALGQFLKAAAPFITLAAIVSIYASIQNLAQEGAENIAATSGQTLAENSIAQITIDNVMAGVKSQLTGLFSSSLTDISMDQAMKVVNLAFDAYQKQDLTDVQKKIKREEAKLAEYAEAKEGSETRHLMLDLMRVQFNPLSRDYSYYDNIFDRPYEPWATEFHSGNIQATTVNALWTTDSKNGIIK